jgi:hypothetical protein
LIQLVKVNKEQTTGVGKEARGVGVDNETRGNEMKKELHIKNKRPY